MFKNNFNRNLMLMLILISFSFPSYGQVANIPLDSQTKNEIIDSVCKILADNYLFPEVGIKMADFIQKQFKKNKYLQTNYIREFTILLTKDLQSVSHDEHIRIRYNPDLPPPDTSSEEEKEKASKKRIEIDQKQNFYFKEVKILEDNIGYMRLDKFADLRYAGPVADAAMNFLANCKALIIDLRYNGGGHSAMVQLLLSYFFDEPVHFNSFYNRKSNKVKQDWSFSYVNGSKLLDVDLYVLTSNNYTFSAAEGFAFALKNLSRATIVGETTSGGAHSIERFYLREHLIEMRVPTARAYDPKTGLYWEGTGVEPDVKTIAKDAFDKACHLAMQNFIKKEEAVHQGVEHSNGFNLKDLGIEMILVEGGSYEMGDIFGEGKTDELPIHKVTLDSFYISKTEITFDQFDKFCDALGRNKPNDEGWGRSNRPVINVSWYDARDFCAWLSMKTNQEIRLPTEAEWEYAAREGGEKVRFGNGKFVANPQEINFNGDEINKKILFRIG